MSENYGLLLNDDKDQSIVTSALELAKNQLYSFANSSDFQTKMQLAFGVAVDSNSFQIAWQNQDFSVVPNIEVRTGSELGGAIGAYAQATNTIYLSQDYLDQNAANIGSITSVLLEEIGHAVDAKVNVVDTPGEEGAIFSGVVQGNTFEPEQIQQLKAKDDHATITLDGQILQIEQATTGRISGGFEGSTKTIKLDSKGGGTATYSYQMFTIPDNLILRYEGKDILNTGFVSGSKTGTVNIPKGNSDELQVVLATNNSGTAWNYQIDTSKCPQPSLLNVVLVSGTEEEKDGKCILKGIINIGLKGSSSTLKVDGTVQYDDKTVSVDGVVYSLIGSIAEPLFKGQFELDKTGSTSSLTDVKGSLANEFKLGNLIDIDFSSLTLQPAGIALKGSFLLPTDLGGTSISLDGIANSLFIDNNGPRFGRGGKIDLPSGRFLLFKKLGIEATDWKIEFIPAEKNTLKVQGKATLKPFFKWLKGTDIVADLSDKNFIQIKDGKPGFLTSEKNH